MQSTSQKRFECIHELRLHFIYILNSIIIPHLYTNCNTIRVCYCNYNTYIAYLFKGSTYNGQWDFWYGPSGRTNEYNYSRIINSLSGIALKTINKFASLDQMKTLRKLAEISCGDSDNDLKNTVPCKPLKAPCLFNILKDPCERRNVANE